MVRWRVTRLSLSNQQTQLIATYFCLLFVDCYLNLSIFMVYSEMSDVNNGVMKKDVV